MALWTPAQISTALWLDAADSSTITLTDGKVSEWRDKSGLARHAAQSSSTLRPAVLSEDMNGKDCLNFASNALDAPGVVINSNFTAFFVGTVNSNTSSFGRALSLRNSAQAQDFSNTSSIVALYRPSSNQEVGIQFNSVDRGLRSVTYGAAFQTASVIDTSQITLYKDGTGAAPSTVTHALNTTAGLRIGNSNWSTSRTEYWNGKICEIVFLIDTSNTNRQLVEGYLAHKWGIAGSLPSGHPYKDSAPALKTISGIIYDRNGDPCKRKVYAVTRPTNATAPVILAHGLSDAVTGEYELLVPTEDEVTRVVVSEDDADPLLNDLVDRVIPE
jgi:hypothetical protein